MATRTLIALVVFSIVSLCGAAADAAIEGEVAYLFDQIDSNDDETTPDATGNGLDGTLGFGIGISELGLSTDTPFPYEGNMSMTFGGDSGMPPTVPDDDHITITDPVDGVPNVPPKIDLGTGDFTIEAWVKVNVTGFDACVGCGIYYSKPVPIAGNPQGIQFQTHHETGPGKIGVLRLTLQDNNLDPSPEVIGSKLPTDAWHHVAAILDRSGVHGTPNTAYIFLDGVKDGEVDVTGLGDISADGAWMNHETYSEIVGAFSQWNSGETNTVTEFNGLMDEFRILKRVLTQAELDARQTTSLHDMPMGVPGDFDGNGVVDAEDIDLLCDQLGSNVPPADEKFDLNGDGTVNSTDADELILVILGTEYGDADLMGGATLGDLGTLAGNFTSTRTDFGWADGDFNWDGEVTLADLGILAANFGSGNGPVQGEFEEAAEELFGVPFSDLVPEPATAVLMSLLGLVMLRRGPHTLVQ